MVGDRIHPYQSGQALVDPDTALQRHLDRGDHLVQPLLSSHAQVAGGHPHDVVTLRVVTRTCDGEHEGFSAALEVPSSRPGAGLTYANLAVNRGGLIIGDARPPWMGAGTNGSSLEDAVISALAGRSLPVLAEAVAIAQRAHACFADVFAVAWDLAITPDGPVVLEGNTGFATVVPQWIGGGLLAGMP